jgi:very-short-patch-repair endonuclease
MDANRHPAGVHYRFWTSHELREQGWTKRQVTAAVADGRLLAVRRGHFAAPGTPPDLVRAMRVGGPATASTAAAAYGFWTPPDPPLSVAVAENAPRLRDPDDAGRPLDAGPAVQVHRLATLPRGASITGVLPVVLVLQHLLQTTPGAFAVASIDSALRHRCIRPDDLAVLAARLPDHLRLLVSAVDVRCESGIESVARYLLQSLGLRVEPQVSIPGVGRVDLLVEGRLIVELDGREYHEGRFAGDRARDATAASQGYRTLRFTWLQVLTDWPSVQAAVLAALRS